MKTLIFTYGIIVLTSVLSYYVFSNRSVYENLLFSVKSIKNDKEYYRLLTSAFVHNDTGHLLFNMFSLYAFASGIESAFGHMIIASVYLASTLCGSLLSLLMHRNETGYRAAGASGGVCGVIFSSIFLLPGGEIIIFPLPIPLPAWLYAILFISFSLYGMKKSSDGIGHDAHLGGSFAGIALSAAVKPESVASRPLLLAGIFIPVIIFFLISNLKKLS